MNDSGERKAARSAGGWSIIAFDSIGSTNHEARRRAYGGAPGRTVITAREQLTGRGREGRVWYSPPGNLYLSALLRLDLRSRRCTEIAFVAGLAVADAIGALLPPGRTATLKWPNDVLISGVKVAGVLIETAGDAVIVGIGVNVEHHPTEMAYPATSLQHEGAAAGVEDARDAVLAALSTRLVQWEGEGFASIRADWRSRGPAQGTRLRLSRGGMEGRFAGLDTDGALLLDTPAGRQRVLVGDVLPL